MIAQVEIYPESWIHNHFQINITESSELGYIEKHFNFNFFLDRFGDLKNHFQNQKVVPFLCFWMLEEKL